MTQPGPRGPASHRVHGGEVEPSLKRAKRTTTEPEDGHRWGRGHQRATMGGRGGLWVHAERGRCHRPRETGTRHHHTRVTRVPCVTQGDATQLGSPRVLPPTALPLRVSTGAADRVTQGNATACVTPPPPPPPGGPPSIWWSQGGEDIWEGTEGDASPPCPCKPVEGGGRRSWVALNSGWQAQAGTG